MIVVVIAVSSLLALVYVSRMFEAVFLRTPAQGAPRVKEAPIGVLAPLLIFGGALVEIPLTGVPMPGPVGLTQRAGDTASPELVDGLRLAAPAALVGAIFGEWFGADSGLGLLLITSMQNFRIDLLWATALLGVAASLIAYGGFSLARWAAWRRYT